MERFFTDVLSSDSPIDWIHDMRENSLFTAHVYRFAPANLEDLLDPKDLDEGRDLLFDIDDFIDLIVFRTTPQTQSTTVKNLHNDPVLWMQHASVTIRWFRFNANVKDTRLLTLETDNVGYLSTATFVSSDGKYFSSDIHDITNYYAFRPFEGEQDSLTPFYYDGNKHDKFEYDYFVLRSFYTPFTYFQFLVMGTQAKIKYLLYSPSIGYCCVLFVKNQFYFLFFTHESSFDEGSSALATTLVAYRIRDYGFVRRFRNLSKDPSSFFKSLDFSFEYLSFQRICRRPIRDVDGPSVLMKIPIVTSQTPTFKRTTAFYDMILATTDF